MRIVSIAHNVPGPVAVARLVADRRAGDQDRAAMGRSAGGLCKRWYDDLHRGIAVERIDLEDRRRPIARIDGAAGRRRCVFRQPSAVGARAARTRCRDRYTQRFPSLRHVNIVGDTANPEEPGHDLTYQARAGLAAPAAMPLTLFADMAGAERAHAAIKDVMQRAGQQSRSRSLRRAARSCGAAALWPDRGRRTPRRRQSCIRHLCDARRRDRGSRARAALPRATLRGSRTAGRRRSERRLRHQDRDRVGAMGRGPRSSARRDQGALRRQGSRRTSTMHRAVLETAHAIASEYLDEVASRHVGGTASHAIRCERRLAGRCPSARSDPVLGP